MNEKNKPHPERKAPPKKDNGGMGEGSNTVPNIKPTEIELPPLNPPVPNRAWTEMRDVQGQMKTCDLAILPDDERRGIFLSEGDNI